MDHLRQPRPAPRTSARSPLAAAPAYGGQSWCPPSWPVTSLDEKRHIFAWTTYLLGFEIVGRHQVEAIGAQPASPSPVHFSGLLGAIIARIYRDLSWEFIKPAKPTASAPAAKPQWFSARPRDEPLSVPNEQSDQPSVFGSAFISVRRRSSKHQNLPRKAKVSS